MFRFSVLRFSGAVVAAVGLLVAAPAAPSSAHGASSSAGDWTTYGYDVQRTGSTSGGRALTPYLVGRLHQRWTARLDGVSNTSPLVASQVQVGGRSHTVTYVGSDHGTLYAIDAGSGTVLWSRFLGRQQTQCSDLPGGVFGITGTPVIDEGTQTIYAVGGSGKLYALNLATGSTVPGYPLRLLDDPGQEHVWGALTLLGNRLYAGTASYCDFRPYHGRIILSNVATAKVVTSFYPDGRRGPNGGGVWGWGGVSIDPSTGTVYASTGNAFARTEHVRFAEHVVALSDGLRPRASNFPAPLVGEDVDFGSTPTLYQAPGCPTQLAVENKSGVLFTYDRQRIDAGPVQRLQLADVTDDEFVGMPAYSTADRMLYVANSSDSSSAGYRHGMVAFKVGADCQLHLAWQHTLGPDKSVVSTPTIAAGVVYYGAGTGDRIYALNARTGRLLWTSGNTISGPVFAAPSVAHGQLYAATWDGYLHAYALPGS